MEITTTTDIRKLRIVLEKTNKGVIKLIYAGQNTGQAMELMREVTDAPRALYWANPTRLNRAAMAKK